MANRSSTSFGVNSSGLPALPPAWRWVEFSEVCGRVSVGHVGPTTEFFADGPDSVRFLRSQNVRPGKLELENAASITADFHKKLKKSRLMAGDILFVRVGANRGDCCVVPKNLGELNCANIVFARPKSPTGFHAYFFQSDLGRNLLLSASVGAAQGVINTGSVASMPVPLPPLPIQQRIADILMAYDELIENNQRRIRTLEAIARALYREWFVHFRFPGNESVPIVPSPLGDIPLGWEIKKLGSISEIVLGGTPSRNVNEYWEGGTIPWLKSGKLNDIRVIEGTEYISQAGLDNSAAKLMPPKTVLVAITGAIQISFLEIEACANQSVIGMYGFKRVCPEYVHIHLSENISVFESKMSGSAQQHINKEIVRETLLPIPPERIAKDFAGLIQPLYEEIKQLLLKSQNLSRTRNLLLPRLVSGQINVEAMPS